MSMLFFLIIATVAGQLLRQNLGEKIKQVDAWLETESSRYESLLNTLQSDIIGIKSATDEYKILEKEWHHRQQGWAGAYEKLKDLGQKLKQLTREKDGQIQINKKLEHDWQQRLALPLDKICNHVVAPVEIVAKPEEPKPAPKVPIPIPKPVTVPKEDKFWELCLLLVTLVGGIVGLYHVLPDDTDDMRTGKKVLIGIFVIIWICVTFFLL